MNKITTFLMMFVVAQNILAQIPAGKKSSVPYMYILQKRANQN